MSSASVAPPAAPRLLQEIELLMRNRFRFYADLRDGAGLRHKILAMLVFAPLFLALFGAVIGSDHSFWQALSSAVKLPALFLLSLLICLPTLYFFNTLFESSLSLAQNFALLLAAVTMTAVVLLKCPASPHVYRLENDQKRWIRDIPTLLSEGHVWEDVRYITCPELNALPDGPPIPPDAGSPP